MFTPERFAQVRKLLKTDHKKRGEYQLGSRLFFRTLRRRPALEHS